MADETTLNNSAEPELQPRRRFFERLSIALGALAAAVVAIPSGLFLLLPAFKRAPQVWRPVGPLGSFVPGANGPSGPTGRHTRGARVNAGNNRNRPLGIATTAAANAPSAIESRSKKRRRGWSSGSALLFNVVSSAIVDFPHPPAGRHNEHDQPHGR